MNELLPEIVTKRIAVSVKSAAERSIRNRHPWIFDGAIVKMSKVPETGDLAIVFDKRTNKFLAAGLYDAESPIRIKVLQFMQSARIDKAWFKHRIHESIAKRAKLRALETNSYRLVHGENDGLPSLIVDMYDMAVVVKLYSAIWFPYLQEILEIIQEELSCEMLVLRLSRNVQRGECYGLRDGQIMKDTRQIEVVKSDDQLNDGSNNDGSNNDGDKEELEEQKASNIIVFKEYGVLFSANVIKGHKTGYFLDHRDNRYQIGQMSKGKTVLDIFAYAGGFSVHAMAGGARKVTSVDISKHALNMASSNMRLNDFDIDNHELICGDAFEIMDSFIQSRRRWDIVIVDPPSFAKSAGEVDRAIESYHRLAELAIKLVNNGGTLLMASCSSRVNADMFFETIESGFDETDRMYRLRRKSFHDIDHPIGFPEGAYLKSGYYKVG